MSSSASPLAMLLLIAAGSGVGVLAIHEATKDSDLTEQPSAGTYRSRVFDVSPTHGLERRPAEETAVGPGVESSGSEGAALADPGSGTWLADSLAQLEESYQAMRHQGEEALHTLADEARPDPALASMASPARLAVPAETPPAEDGQTAQASAPSEQLDPGAAADAALYPNAAVGAGTATTGGTAVATNTALPTSTAHLTAPDGSPLNPEEAARAEQLRIAVALEKHQAFIISMLPLFLPVPAAADASVPVADTTAAAVPLVDMSGLAWGPVDMSGTTSP